MMLEDVMNRLKSLGSEQTVKTFRRHGAPENMYGVKVADLKVILKQIKGRQELVQPLWDTGNSDARYLASLLGDSRKMSTRQLNDWAKTADWYMLSEYAVPFVAAEHPDATKLAMKWIDSKSPDIQSSGWSTYSLVVMTRDDEVLDLEQIRELLNRCETSIHQQANRVRYVMNGFVISVGAGIKELFPETLRIAKAMGKVHVEIGETACKVPDAVESLTKIESMKRIGKKKSSTKC